MNDAATLEAPSSALAKAVLDLDLDTAKSLHSAFSQMFGQADEWVRRASEIRVTDESQKREMKLARESRLALKEIRTTAEHTRKRLKEDSLRKGKAIDGIANVLKALIEPIEAHLLEQETFAERAAKARADALRDARSDALQALGVPAMALPAELGSLSEEEWACILTDAKEAKAMRQERARLEEEARVEAAKIVAQREAEARAKRAQEDAERLAREAEQKAENERLRAIAKEKEAETRARLEAEAAERRRQEETQRETERAREREAREKAEREAAELRAKLEAAQSNAANDTRSLPVPDGREQGHPESAAMTPVMGRATEEARASHVGAPGLVQQGIPERGGLAEGSERRGHYQEPQAEYGAGGDSEERLGFSRPLPNGSASANERTIACPAWLAFPHVYRSNKYAARGHVIHGYQRAILAGVAQEIALAQVPEAYRETCKRIDWSKLCGDLDEIESEVSYALDVRARTARVLGTNLGRDYVGAARRAGHPLGPWEVPGSLDITGRRRLDRLRVVADTKSGFQEVTEAESNGQALFFASVFMLLEGDDKVMVRMAKLKPNGDIWNDVATFGALDCDEYMDTLEAALERSKQDRRLYLSGGIPDVYPSGDNCQYCPAFSACPSKVALARSMLGDLMSIRGRIQTMTQEDRGLAWEKAHDGVKPLLDKVLEALKEAARAEPLPLSNGYELREAPYEKTQTDFGAAVALARDLGATEAQIAACSPTITVRPVVARKRKT
jgi:hypothetical protein